MNSTSPKFVKTSYECVLCHQKNVKRLTTPRGYRKPSMTLNCATCGWVTPGLVVKS